MGPFIFIAMNRIRPGKLDDERGACLAGRIRPGERAPVARVQRVRQRGGHRGRGRSGQPDAQSMAFHMGVVAERAAGSTASAMRSSIGS